jgi:hypothetical protein
MLIYVRKCTYVHETAIYVGSADWEKERLEGENPGRLFH